MPRLLLGIKKWVIMSSEMKICLILKQIKLFLEVPAPHDGILEAILSNEGQTVRSGDVLAHLNDKASAAETTENKSAKAEERKEENEDESATSPCSASYAC